MKFKINPLSKLVAPCFVMAIVAASSAAEASITISFTEQGNDVIAITRGSLRTAQFGSFDRSGVLGFAEGISASSEGLIAVDPAGSATGGTILDFNNNSGVFSLPDAFLVSSATPSFFTGTAFGFGFADNSLFIEDGEARNGGFDDSVGIGGASVAIIEPTTVWTFQNQTLEDIGLGFLSTPDASQIVYTDNLTGDTIIFIPEPSSMLMLALGAVGFTFRRRR